jgi:hypothetical protein
MQNSHTKDRRDIGELRAEKEAGVSLRHLVTALLVFYLVAAILNGRHLYEAAERRPYGPVRSVWLVALTPARAVSTALGADRLRASVENFLD